MAPSQEGDGTVPRRKAREKKKSRDGFCIAESKSGISSLEEEEEFLRTFLSSSSFHLFKFKKKGGRDASSSSSSSSSFCFLLG